MDGAELRQRRKEMKLTQAEFAALLGMHSETIGGMERGTSKIRQSTIDAVLALSPKPISDQKRMSDPFKRLIAEALVNAGIGFRIDQLGSATEETCFYLLEYRLSLVVGRHSSASIASATAPSADVIVAQGGAAVRFLAAAIRSGDFFEIRQAERRAKSQIKRQSLI